METATTYIGKPIRRVDGRAKVTGEAKYVAEFNVPNLLYGVVVSSGIAKGTITKLDTAAALAVEGVVEVLTHENAPRTAWLDRSYQDEIAPAGSPFRPLRGTDIVFSQQPIALVVAETFEAARYAASLVHVEYDADEPHTDLEKSRPRAPKKGKVGFFPPPAPRGHPERAFEGSTATMTGEYYVPSEHHNPMEMHASTVQYGDDGHLTIYDKTQGVQNSQKYVCSIFGLSTKEVTIRSPFLGGGFGSGLRPNYQLFLAVLAARALKRSVRVSLTRQQMWSFSHRPETIQNLAIGANRDGLLESITHTALGETSRYEDHVEVVVNWSGQLYRCDNVKMDYHVAELDVATPADMRTPGAVTGLYALESAMDECAYAAGVDPLEFRLRNYGEKDYNEDKPWSSKELRQAYKLAAEKFGWSKRSPAPRSMRDGEKLVGWGLGTGIWDAQQGKASARAVLTADGKLTVSSATSDIGTGTYTIMTQIAADTLGLPLEDVSFQLGDSTLPMSPVEGGSWTASSVGTAVMEVCDVVRGKLFKLARGLKGSPLAKVERTEVSFAEGQIRLTADPSKFVSITEAMRQGKTEVIDEETTAIPNLLKQAPYTRSTHSAVFVEVKVDESLGSIQVTRVVSAIAAGRIINPQTARSQIIGAVVWGLSMALHEESVMDHRLGRFMNHNFAEYHIPVCADIHDIEVIFVPEHDDIVCPLGVKGLGEIGNVGVAAAVANAVFHATGKRVRDLPITPDKLL